MWKLTSLLVGVVLLSATAVSAQGVTSDQVRGIQSTQPQMHSPSGIMIPTNTNTAINASQDSQGLVDPPKHVYSPSCVAPCLWENIAVNQRFKWVPF